MPDELYRASQEGDHDVFPCVWYALGWSKELKQGRLLRKRIAGRDLVLFRDSAGTVQALHAYCPHRGADLSLGSCEGDLLRCPYHAWTFKGDGTCTSIPAHPDRPIPSFAHTLAYPVQEQAGLLWVYPMTMRELNGRKPEPPALFPELDDPDLVLAPYDAVWEAHLTRVIESVIDVAHVPIVHRRTIGRNSSSNIHIDFEAEGDRITIRNGSGLLNYRFPQQWLLTPAEPRRSRFTNYVTFSPVDREVTAIFGYAGRNFAKFPGVSRIFSLYSAQVLDEDRAVVESQHPRPIPDALRMEAHVGADGPQVRFRQRWYQFLTGEEPRISAQDRLR
ncbi:Rieske iron-sulfur domain-containing protein [Paenibacillus mucilaginosus 3016]|uniref:Rieske iron-sulfur domain-containing protein n=1 Tax=Paenibacillus mucilaginosus 3016 TaxID=1116391 RepID=H6NSQ3_9BACL|nr:aromatic ring-hydroxylating dioxygenase subunit alpha [Paenibacillus mucilaginosus]AFC27474.1 Rieske iron-sulfur domain-containing protein [Paenibacillus mucilaginosus 3016]WFA16378.1 aromatic ring-hydroxylating dioxygenase subunit alpha [Paenibacillus mucilaginosus]